MISRTKGGDGESRRISAINAHRSWNCLFPASIQ
jgi:hypothetical protein